MDAFFKALAFTFICSSLGLWIAYLVGYERGTSMGKTCVTNKIRTLRFFNEKMTQQQLADKAGSAVIQME